MGTKIYKLVSDRYGKPGFYSQKDFEFTCKQALFEVPELTENVNLDLSDDAEKILEYRGTMNFEYGIWSLVDERNQATETDNFEAIDWQNAYNDACDYLYQEDQNNIDDNLAAESERKSYDDMGESIRNNSTSFDF